MPPILVCVPVNMPNYLPGQDYVPVSCEICTDKIWLGPKQAIMKQSNSACQVICPNCCMALYGKEALQNVKHLDPKAGGRLPS